MNEADTTTDPPPDIAFTLGGFGGPTTDRGAATPPDVEVTVSTERPVPVPPAPDAEVTVTVEEPDPAAPIDIDRYATGLGRAIADTLLPAAPVDWRRLDVAFSVTVRAIAAVAYFTDDVGEVTPVPVPREAGELAQLLREVTVPLAGHAWWRVLLHCVRDDSEALAAQEDSIIELEYDYGAVPFTGDELHPPEAYRADLAAFPRARLPIWLAAYIDHADRQSRPPRRAIVRSRTDRSRGITPEPAGLPAPDLIWARWATISAAAVAIGSDAGPRVLGSSGVFEASNGSGSTLHLLTARRAVLSGGVWDAPELDAAYNDGADLPDLYAGAPEWLANPVLDQRVTTGLLTFCYWWEGGGWFRGRSPEPAAIGAAIPGLWTPTTTADVVCAVLGPQADRDAVVELVAAAETRTVTTDMVLTALDVTAEADVVGAMYQFALAGLTNELSE
ncbi:hypothetical protein ACWDSJ_24770 [Nocardia sp. NPDC003482]